MARETIRAEYVNPQIMVWARETAGFSRLDAAERLGVSPEKLVSWEVAEAYPTIKQLEKMARVYKRPLAAFFLPHVPEEKFETTDFRYVDSRRGKASMSPNLRFEIRRIRNRRTAAIELYKSLEGSVPIFPLRAQLDEDPEQVAKRIREALAIPVEEQLKWKQQFPPYHAFRKWRVAIQRLNVLVMHIAGVEVSEARGFSLGESEVPAIAVNAKDSITGRIFTLHHELTHLALRQGGLCDLVEDFGLEPNDDARRKTEAFCNHVAGAILVPQDSLLQHPVVKKSGYKDVWGDKELLILSRDFKVSLEVVLRRLVLLKKAPLSFYQAKREELSKVRTEKKGEGFLPPASRALRDNGALFVRLALDALYSGHISLADVPRLLDVGWKHLPDIEKAIENEVRD